MAGKRGNAVAKQAVEQALTDQQIVTMSSVMGRALLSRALGGGTQFNGVRDMYEVLGYPREILFSSYLEKYLRQDIAGKVIDLPAQDTWRKPPKIKDGDEDSSMEGVRSPFLQGIQYLVEKRRMWHYLQRVDRLAGVGRYGVLLIGTTGAAKLSDELLANSLRTPQDVLYLSVFSEGSAMITSLNRDTNNERFGLPAQYTITFGEGLGAEPVHWSRVLHVAEDLLEDDIYGLPRLQRVYNRLEDLIKQVGGGSEATWKNMDRGLHADVRDGFDLPDADALSDEIDEYIHGLRRFIRTQGVDINSLGSETVDPTGLFEATVALIAAASDIPQRILLGSERGELASSQDQANWSGVIASRQTQHAEPAILRPFIDRLVKAGALPKPSSGKYAVEWMSLFELNELEKAKVADTYATAIQKAAPAGSPDLIVQPGEFREKFLGMPPMEIEETILDEEDASEDADADASEGIIGDDDANDEPGNGGTEPGNPER